MTTYKNTDDDRDNDYCGANSLSLQVDDWCYWMLANSSLPHFET